MSLDLIAEQIKYLKKHEYAVTARYDIVNILESIRIVLSEQDARLTKLEEGK